MRIPGFPAGRGRPVEIRPVLSHARFGVILHACPLVYRQMYYGGGLLCGGERENLIRLRYIVPFGGHEKSGTFLFPCSCFFNGRFSFPSYTQDLFRVLNYCFVFRVKEHDFQFPGSCRAPRSRLS